MPMLLVETFFFVFSRLHPCIVSILLHLYKLAQHTLLWTPLSSALFKLLGTTIFDTILRRALIYLSAFSVVFLICSLKHILSSIETLRYLTYDFYGTSQYCMPIRPLINIIFYMYCQSLPIFFVFFLL